MAMWTRNRNEKESENENRDKKLVSCPLLYVWDRESSSSHAMIVSGVIGCFRSSTVKERILRKLVNE